MEVFLNHMDRRHGMVSFKRGACNINDCMCQSTPVKAKEVFKLSTSDRWHLAPVTPDPSNPDHYLTFTQAKKALHFSEPDQHLTKAKYGRCDKCRAYVYTSASDKDRHILIVHGGKHSYNSANKTKQQHVCKICEVAFDTRYKLQKHQLETGHKLTKGRPKTQ